MTDLISLASIYRYPVKGLSAEPMPSVSLQVGQTLPFDRAYAIENGPGRFDPHNPRHLPKITFLMLMRDERLATLHSTFDATTETLTILRDGKQVARGNLSTPIGRKMIEQFFAAYMKTELRGAPKVVSAPDHSFSDVAAKCVHIVNLASVRDLERLVGRPIDPLRFRANLYIDGAKPWDELNWVGKTITLECFREKCAAVFPKEARQIKDLGSFRDPTNIGTTLGDTKLKVFKRTQRCDATNVDPQTGQRDMALPANITRAFGHADFGIYAMVITAGEIATGQHLTLEP